MNKKKKRFGEHRERRGKKSLQRVKKQ